MKKKELRNFIFLMGLSNILLGIGAGMLISKGIDQVSGLITSLMVVLASLTTLINLMIYGRKYRELAQDLD